MTVDGPTRVRVGGSAPYDVVVGRNVLSELPSMLPSGVAQVAVVRSDAVRAVAGTVRSTLTAAGVRPLDAVVPDGESAKDLGTAGRLWGALGEAGFTRTDAVVAVGGGAVTDLAGFVAATWLRGVAVVHVPTTLLGMVDAAVGGKTAINTPQGKNLVGAFHPPAGVLCDLATLDTLPHADYVSGLAEVVKTGFLADPAILELIEGDPSAAALSSAPVARDLVERSVRVKAEVVTGDLRDSGRREFLNYGHTLGHAIERVEGYRWRHGEAVSVGLVFAAALGRLAGRLDVTTAQRHRAVLELLGLPVRYPARRWPALLDTMRLDKKSRGRVLRFVVLDGLARPAMLEDPDPALLAAAFAEVSAP